MRKFLDSVPQNNGMDVSLQNPEKKPKMAIFRGARWRLYI